MDGGLAGFFRQIPTGLIVMFCGSGLLLFSAVAYLTWSRGRRARAKVGDTTVTQSVGLISMEEAKMQLQRDDMPVDEDMPDLDALSRTGEVESAPTAPQTAPPPRSDSAAMIGKFAAPEPLPSVEIALDSAPADPSAELTPAPARETANYRLSLNDGGTADVVEVMTILRDISDGSLIIQMGDRAYRFPAGAADADFKRRLSRTMRDLIGAPSAPSPTSSAPGIGARPAAPTAASPNASPPSGRPTGTTAPSGAAPGDLPKFRLEDLPPPVPRGRKLPTVEIPEINIGASIEAFLQHKRAANGDFPGRRIHVRSGQGGAIVIEVDGEFFDAVSDIEDAAVRAYLQDTIAEWQSRQ